VLSTPPAADVIGPAILTYIERKRERD